MNLIRKLVENLRSSKIINQLYEKKTTHGHDRRR